jgi:hypothetical protein
LITYGFSEEVVRGLIEGGRLTMREGAWAFLNTLNKNRIPIRILSAGIANVIETQFCFHDANTPNLHISANTLSMDTAGIATHYKRPLHTLNKTSGDAKSETFYRAATERPNLLLLGDTLEDARMKLVTPHTHVISIGFLCDSDLHEQFTRTYDAVVHPDGSFQIANSIINTITDKGSN